MSSAITFSASGRRSRLANDGRSSTTAAADQPVVPAEVIVEVEIEELGLAARDEPEPAPARLGFHAAAAERPENPAVGEEDCPRARLLGCRAGRVDHRRKGEGPTVTEQ